MDGPPGGVMYRAPYDANNVNMKLTCRARNAPPPPWRQTPAPPLSGQGTTSLSRQALGTASSSCQGTASSSGQGTSTTFMTTKATSNKLISLHFLSH